MVLPFAEQKRTAQKDEETPVKTRVRTSGKIIEMIIENAYVTIPEMANSIGLTERSVERNIHQLQKDGLIQRVGPAKGGYWIITELQ